MVKQPQSALGEKIANKKGPRPGSHPSLGGGKWVRPEKRLAIYLRDGLACVWCGAGLEDGDQTYALDHVVPWSKWGSNSEKNLVTSCRRCNSARGSRSATEWAIQTAEYLQQESATEILGRIEALLATRIDRKEAREIIARRKVS